MIALKPLPIGFDRETEIVRLNIALDKLCEVDGFERTKAEMQKSLSRLALENRDHAAEQGWCA